MRSKKTTWLYITISIVALPIISRVLKLIPIPSDNKTISGSFLYLMIHEFAWIIFILLFNHYVIKQRVDFRINNRLNAWLPFLVVAGIILNMIRTTILIPHYNNPFHVFITIMITTLTVGFFEEFSNRGIIFPQILSTFKNINLKTTYASVIISGLVFGCLHFMNLTSQNLLTTIVQVVFTFSIGCIFCAIYIRSGSILFSMIIHAIWDFYSMYPTNLFGDSSNKVLTPSLVASVVINMLFFIGCMFILLRPSQLEPRLKWLRKLVK